jgi:hypothetical protein
MHIQGQAVCYPNGAKQDDGLVQAVLRLAAWRDDVDVVVRASQHACNGAATATETQYRFHHGR